MTAASELNPTIRYAGGVADRLQAGFNDDVKLAIEQMLVQISVLSGLVGVVGDQSAAGFFTSGVLEHERGGLEADVSGYDGLIKISEGVTSQAVPGEDYLDPDHVNIGSGATITEITGQMVFADLTTPDGITLYNLINNIKGLPFFMYRLWRYATPSLDAVYSPPIYVADFEIPSLSYAGPVVIFGANDGYLYCINGEDGTLLWRVDLGDPITGRCQVADVDGDGYYEVFVGVSSGGGEIYCLEDSGSTKWTTSYSEAFAHVGELVDESGSWFLYAISLAGTCIKLDASDGSEEWTPYSTAGGGGALSYPVVIDVDDDSVLEVIFSADDGYVYCLNAATGALKWSYDLGSASAALVRVDDIDNDGDNEIIVGCRDGRTYVLTESGALQDKTPILTAYGYDDIDPAAALIGDDFVVAGAAGIIQRFDSDCESIWRYNIKGSVSADTVKGDINYDSIDELLVADETGQITALTPNGGFLGTQLIRGGIHGTPVLSDLDSDSQLEMIIPSIDGYVEMWRFDDHSLSHVYYTYYLDSYYRLGSLNSSGISMDFVWGALTTGGRVAPLAAAPGVLYTRQSGDLRSYSPINGSLLWQNSDPTVSYDAIMISPSGYIFCAYFSGKYIDKYSSAGVLVDTISFSSVSWYVKNLYLDADGNFLGVKNTQTSSPYSAYAFKIDPAGAVLWDDKFLFSGSYAANCGGAVDADGNLYVTSTLKYIFPVDGETGTVGASFGYYYAYNQRISIDRNYIYWVGAEAPYGNRAYIKVYNLLTQAYEWGVTINHSTSYDQEVQSFAEPGYGYFWIGNNNTLYKYDSAGNFIDSYSVNYNQVALSPGLIGEGHWG